MTKKFFVIILIASSCSGLPLYNDVLSYAKTAFRSVDYPSIEIINASPYALMGAELGNAKVVLVLAYDRDDFLEWVSASSESLITFRGKLIQSAGLKNNIRITHPPDISQIINLHVNQNEEIEWESFISLSNPILTMTSITFRYKIANVMYSQESLALESVMVTEFFDAPSIGWTGKNIYWFTMNGEFLEAKQEISPGTNIRLKSLKPYKRR